MPDPAPQPDPDSAAGQRKILEAIVGELPAFAPGEDTGQGVLAPEGQEANQFYQSFSPQQPAAPVPASGQPVSPTTQPQPAPPPQPAPVQAPAQPSPSGRLFAGKYRSVEEMERGYKEAEKELRARNDENLVLKAAQLATERIGGFRQPREEPAPASEIPIQFRGDQPVVPVGDFRTEVLNAARAAAQEAVSGILTPMQQLGAANSSLKASYPEFTQQEGNFANWLRDNPRYQGLIQNDPELGLESAYLKFRNDAGVQQTHVATQTTLAAQQQVDSARQQAAPAGNVAPATRRVTEQDSRVQELQALYKRFQDTGDPQDRKRFNNAYTAYKLGDGFMNTLERTRWGT